MLGGKQQSIFRNNAIGLVMQSSVYGNAVPIIFGRARGALYLIWAENLRQHHSWKKLLFKKTQPTYAENVDFLLGQNPISGVLQMWEDNNTKLPLNFVSVSPTSISGNYTIPDANFYWLLAVTANQTYNVTFNDYGSTGSVTYSGTYEVPMWNIATQGPNPTRSKQMSTYPFFFNWAPGSGATIFVANGVLGETYDIHVYYAQLDPGGAKLYSKKNSGTDVPIAALNLTFEPVLGDGPEYGATYASQQILYPHYAGLGSPELDLGSSNMIPNIRPEILGSYPYFSGGDCDFMDMVEHIFCSLPQGGYGSTENATVVQNGLSCFDFPGFVQSVVRVDLFSMNTSTFRLPNKAGNILLVLYSNTAALSGCTFTDTAGNAYTTLFSGNDAGVAEGYAAAMATAVAAAPGNVVSASIGASNCTVFLGEIAGVDTYDAGAHFTTGGGTPQITTTSDPGTRALLVAVVIGPQNVTAGKFSYWTQQTATSGTFINQQLSVYTRIVTHPGTYTFPISGTYSVVLLAFKCSNPAKAGISGTSISLPLGDILDRASMDLTRLQCQANGLWGSLVMDSQREASEWLSDILTAADAIPVWSGSKLKILPRSEVSAVGNGAIYNAPTAPGPIANLSDLNGDFIGSGSDPIVKVTRKAQVDAPNVLQFEHPNRANDYNNVIITQPETSTMALYGVRKESPKRIACIVDSTVSRMVLGVAVRQQNLIRNTYQFKLQAKWKLLEPWDLVTINDSQAGINAVPVRLTSITEDEKRNLDCEAEPFIYGCYAPIPLDVTATSPYIPQTGADPGPINTPIIFEPVSRLTNGAQQLWFVVSAPNANFAGSQVYISTDGGSSYNLLGQTTGNATTGVTTADWPAHADPDTADDLPLDLTESLGSLLSYQVSDEDNFTYPCYVAGGTASIPYELMTYAVATLTSTYHYTLKATGAGNKLRRAVFGAPQALQGVDHPSGSRWAFLSPAGTGILKVNMDPSWVGKSLSFKFASFNTMLGAQPDIAGLTAYSYTPAGTVPTGSTAQNSLNYSITPATPLSQPSSTTIDMAQLTANFSTNSANYNARTFTIPDPGAGNKVTYYVTVYDPGYVGDTGSGTNLTAFCETSSAKVGQPGYTYIGSVFAVTGGGGTVTPGGIPVQQVFFINGK